MLNGKVDLFITNKCINKNNRRNVQFFSGKKSYNGSY